METARVERQHRTSNRAQRHSSLGSGTVALYCGSLGMKSRRYGHRVLHVGEFLEGTRQCRVSNVIEAYPGNWLDPGPSSFFIMRLTAWVYTRGLGSKSTVPRWCTYAGSTGGAVASSNIWWSSQTCCGSGCWTFAGEGAGS